jgi:hypothetical protein
MIQNIPALTIEANEDGTLLLEQDWAGNVDRVTVHPVHLRFMAERLGLVREVSASEADMVRTVTTLKRRLRVLLQRIDQLDDWLRQVEAKGHEDLSVETTYSFATWELASEFCADLDELTPCPTASRDVTPSHAAVTRDAPGTASAGTQTKPTGNPAETQRVPTGSAQLTLEHALT